MEMLKIVEGIVLKIFNGVSLGIALCVINTQLLA